MAILSVLLFAGAAVAHTGIRHILIDGNIYHPYDSRIDPLIRPVRRIEWSHDAMGATFNPITNFSDPSLACRENGKYPALKAPARAGAEVATYWTPITRMHNGPALAYLGRIDSPETKPQDVKFFKIYEYGFNKEKDRWANEDASDHYDSFSFKLPSDIKAGTYILRTELIAMHGNMKELKSNGLRGQIQIYPHCFNLEITGSGTATPEGVNFPGAYKVDDAGLTFPPFATYGNDTSPGNEHNSKYVPPGPPKYNGKYDAPVGPLPVPTETGIYSPELETTYQDLIRKIERPALKLATYINTVWPHYHADADQMKAYGKMGAVAGKEGKEVMAGLKADIAAFKEAAGGK
ncbi:hypothetical protein BT63DRAFT_412305 [Microthyrium microscopicum]|uniref:lytic cellulose monooxygenase (C4-dehydrogenating) n=1 Tax=Microthyrium microscopicum TaxID=703497 RepID=A0A6A6UHG6_9PEZI|nr:hypothetical protein BT63DRAFT_412305 [Microthyrium microscopicum]